MHAKLKEIVIRAAPCAAALSQCPEDITILLRHEGGQRRCPTVFACRAVPRGCPSWTTPLVMERGRNPVSLREPTTSHQTSLLRADTSSTTSVSQHYPIIQLFATHRQPDNSTRDVNAVLTSSFLSRLELAWCTDFPRQRSTIRCRYEISRCPGSIFLASIGGWAGSRCPLAAWRGSVGQRRAFSFCCVVRVRPIKTSGWL